MRFTVRGAPTFPYDAIELVTGDASFEFFKARGHVQVLHLCRLLFAIGIVNLGFGLGIQDFGKRDGVMALGQHG